MRSSDLCFLEEVSDANSVALLGIKQGKSQFQLHQEGIESPCDSIWLQVKSLKKKEYRINDEDILRLGRVRLFAKYITEETSFKHFPKQLAKFSEVDVCRICLCESDSEDNPLISPCKCAGSMRFVHADCIKEWLKNKVDIRKTSFVHSYYWKDINCELCKEKLPTAIDIDGKIVELINVKFPDPPFMVLEDYRTDSTDIYGIHLIKTPVGRNVYIGRSHDNHIKLNDISVSRDHARIYFKNNSYFIEDSNSKFGTMAMVKCPFSIFGKATVQVSRSVIHFKVKKPWNLTKCLLCRTHKVVPHLATIGDSKEPQNENSIEDSNE